MRRGPDLVVMPFRQERHGVALLPANLLGGMFGNAVMVGCQHRLGISDVELLLSGLGLALGILDWDTSSPQMIAKRAHQMLFLGGLQDIVILVIAADRRQVAEAGFADVIEALFENEEFQLGGHHRLEAKRPCAGHLTLQHGARRMRHLFMRLVVEDVAKHKHRALKPGQPPDCRQVGLHDVVAITRFPGCGLIALRRRHLQIGGEQIVAAMGFLPRALDKMLGVKPLAGKPPLHVDDTGKDRVDLAGSGRGFQFVKGKLSSHDMSSLGKVGETPRSTELSPKVTYIPGRYGTLTVAARTSGTLDIGMTKICPDTEGRSLSHGRVLPCRRTGQQTNLSTLRAGVAQGRLFFREIAPQARASGEMQ